MSYRPDYPAGITEIPDLVQYLYTEFQKLRLAFDKFETEEIFLQANSAEPPKYEDGMVVRADGSNWDPNNGEGIYARYGAAWNLLGVATGVATLGASATSTVVNDGNVTAASRISLSALTLNGAKALYGVGGGSGLDFLETQALSSGMTAEFDVDWQDTDYDVMQVYFQDLEPSADETLQLRVRTGTTPATDSAGNYSYKGGYYDDNVSPAFAGFGGTAQTAFNLADDGSTSDHPEQGISGFININGHRDTGKHFTFHGQFWNEAVVDGGTGLFINGLYLPTTAVTGIQLKWSSTATFTKGDVFVYGLRNAAAIAVRNPAHVSSRGVGTFTITHSSDAAVDQDLMYLVHE